MDIDSTIQEANIAYPSDAQLMVKMTLLVNQVWTYLKENVSFFADFVPSVDVKAVKAKARAYWFRDGKNVDETQRLFQDLWHEAFTQINHVRKYFQILLDYDIDRMPWNIRRAFDQISRWREIRACNDNICGESKSQNFHDRLLDLTFLIAATALTYQFTDT